MQADRIEKGDGQAWPTWRQVESLRPTATALTASAPSRATARLIVHFTAAAVLVGLCLANLNWLVSLVAAGGIALLFVHGDVIQHEAVHGNVCRSQRSNRLVGILVSAPMAVPFALYSAFHSGHHARTAQVGDPEGRHDVTGRAPLLGESARTLRFWVRQQRVGWRVALGREVDYVHTDEQRATIRFDTVVQSVVVTVLGVASWVYPPVRWAWLVPFTCYVVALFPVFHLYEHANSEWRTENGVAPSNQANVTATIVLHPVLSKLLWHATLHTAHHAFPKVPGDRLEALHDELLEIAHPCMIHAGFISWYRTVTTERRD